MGLRVNNNVAAYNAYRNLSMNDGMLSKSLEKLSSGYRINRAGDDAAGLVISENLRSQVGGLKQANRNAQDGISVVQTAEGALTEVHSMLQRMRDLAVQAGNGSNSSDSIKASQNEFNELGKAINDIADRTAFNGISLLKGGRTTAADTTVGAGSTATFQVGANGNETQSVALTDVGTFSLLSAKSTAGNFVDLAAISGTTYTADSTATASALTKLDSAIVKVSTFRGTLGAAQNRLEHTINNLSVTQENLTASESRIRDTDMALEMTSYTRSQILTQAGTAMLAQANSAPQQVLQLLRG
jgi:flagellin